MVESGSTTPWPSAFRCQGSPGLHRQCEQGLAPPGRASRPRLRRRLAGQSTVHSAVDWPLDRWSPGGEDPGG